MTERHRERRYLDQYFTPLETATRLTRLLPIKSTDSVCEPHVGAAAWLRAVRDIHPTHSGDLIAMDLDPTAPGLHRTSVATHRDVGDFLDDADWTGHRPDWMLGNPPYGRARFKDGVRMKKDAPIAEAHIRTALSRTGRHVCFLLRHGILATAKRAAGIWQEHPPRMIWTLGWRPSFTADGGNDRYDYAFIWWDLEWTGPTGWISLPRIPVDKPVDSVDNPPGRPLIEVLDLSQAPEPVLTPAPPATGDFSFDLGTFNGPSVTPGQFLADPVVTVPTPSKPRPSVTLRPSVQVTALGVPLPAPTDGLDKILLNTGPSPNGWHKAETFMLCPRRRGWDYAGEQEPGKPWHSEATARGTMLHVALAHHYSQVQAVQEDRDPDAFYAPEVALALLPQVETNPADAALMATLIPQVIEAYRGYRADYAMERLKVVAVETVVEMEIPGTGGPGQPPKKTGRVDLIYENSHGQIVFMDHKSAGRITREHKWQYSRSGQFLMMRWLGAALGDRFGGVVLNLVQVGNQGKRNERPTLDAVPGFLTSLPLSIGYWERQRIAFEESGLPPELWPAVPSEHSCRGRYASRCPHASKCDSAIPPITTFDWPTIDLQPLIDRLSGRTP